ncbi:PREDICTED: cystatin-2-like [Nanorana parkeri]|uniref:cystatin-2-like n=1 Tax=Nanorana parkeri TaxID=125878 RepID=UPI000854CDD5|nr:PREDICTED: cystatin-2-like [Nanorana parkeri]
MAGRVALSTGLLCALLSFSCAQLLGGWETANKNSKMVKEIAAFSVSQYNLQSNERFLSKIISVLDAKQQVVAGMNYELTILLGNTACKKGKNYMNKPCPLLTGSKLKKVKCIFTVYDIPWENERTLEGKQCAPI